MKHIIPLDDYKHTEDVSCLCRPTVGVVDGKELCVHNEVSSTGMYVADIAGDIDPEYTSTNTL